MSYVDGFVITLPKKNLPAYFRMARVGAQVWREHGALDYKECVGDDLNIKMGLPFPRLAKVKRGDMVIFSYIVYKSRAHRDRVNARVMKDPRIAASCNEKNMPFDMKHMTYGGFKVVVDGGSQKG